jgi:hypothetical protein
LAGKPHRRESVGHFTCKWMVTQPKCV